MPHSNNHRNQPTPPRPPPNRITAPTEPQTAVPEVDQYGNEILAPRVAQQQGRAGPQGTTTTTRTNAGGGKPFDYTFDVGAGFVRTPCLGSVSDDWRARASGLTS
jgi:hypothetical protein